MTTKARLDAGKSAARGLAALIVSMEHAYGLFIAPHVGYNTMVGVLLEQGAHQAVMIFFAISGFLITSSILQNVRRNGTFDFFDFLISRLARIYPPLFYSIAICLVFQFFIQSYTLPGSSIDNPYSMGIYPQMRMTFQLSTIDLRNTLLMSDGSLLVNGPLWSLCIEWWIYIIVGLSVFLITASGITRKLATGILLVYSVKKLFAINDHSTFYLIIWLFGCCMAVCRTRYGWFNRKRWGFCFLLFASISIIGNIFPELILAGGRFYGFRESSMQLLISIFWCSLVLPDLRVGSQIAWRVLTKLGDCSYTLYIVHFPIMLFALSVFQHLFTTSLSNSIIAASISMSLALAVSGLSAELFENKKLFLGWIEQGLSYLPYSFTNWLRARQT